MNFEFLSSLSDSSDWKILKQQLLSKHIPNFKKKDRELSSYQLIHVLVDDDGKPISYRSHSEEPKTYIVFTQPSLIERFENAVSLEEIYSESVKGSLDRPKSHTKMMMIGELIETLKDSDGPTPIKINPVLTNLSGSDTPFLLCEEVLFAPAFDKFTKKSLLTDPADAKALLAVDHLDEKRFGIELTFYMITNNGLALEGEERRQSIREKIDELAFVAPRVPMKKGSGTFLIVILNLEDEIEEQAFIRDYKMFDSYSNVLFVTSSLRLLTGQLDEVHYNGESIDTIFYPMIEWQKNLS